MKQRPQQLMSQFASHRHLTFYLDLRENKRQFNSNAELIGYQNYEQLPALLEQIDVCLIPFKRKPVVSTNLPEVRKLQPYVRLAHTPESFINEVRKAYSIRGKQVKKRSQYVPRHFPGFSSSCGPVPKIPTYSASSFSLEIYPRIFLSLAANLRESISVSSKRRTRCPEHSLKPI
ncbi:hypothetical protein ABNF65_17220 [Paenibacillus larvae]